MSNCDNCLHRYICPVAYEVHDCLDFDDKSEYIHIPYRFGSVVWYIKGNSRLKSAEVLGMGVSKNDFERLFLCDTNGSVVFTKETDKVYPTYEEAEKALKESGNNA